MPDPDELSERASRLAEGIAAALRDQAALERIEVTLFSALSEAVVQERERCAGLAEERAQMWQHSKLNDASWPAQGRTEAQHRYREAVAIADAIRAGLPQPPLA
jgi:hypothetical protein